MAWRTELLRRLFVQSDTNVCEKNKRRSSIVDLSKMRLSWVPGGKVSVGVAYDDLLQECVGATYGDLLQECVGTAYGDSLQQCVRADYGDSIQDSVVVAYGGSLQNFVGADYGDAI